MNAIQPVENKTSYYHHNSLTNVATQEEAEAGVNNVKLMTPLRTAEAISALGGGGSEPAYQEYEAILTQTGTNAPIATVLNTAASNYLGAITWTRSAPGTYYGEKTGAFPANKVIVQLSKKYIQGGFNPYPVFMTAGRTFTDNQIVLNVGRSQMGSDYLSFEDNLFSSPDVIYITIRVYP